MISHSNTLPPFHLPGEMQGRWSHAQGVRISESIDILASILQSETQRVHGQPVGKEDGTSSWTHGKVRDACVAQSLCIFLLLFFCSSKIRPLANWSRGQHFQAEKILKMADIEDIHV